MVNPVKKEWRVKQLKHENLLEGLRLDRGVELEFEYEKQLHDPFLMSSLGVAFFALTPLTE